MAVAKHNAVPYIPFKINTAVPMTNNIWVEMYYHFMAQRWESIASWIFFNPGV